MYVYQSSDGRWQVATLTSLQFTAPELWRLFILHPLHFRSYETEGEAREAKMQIEIDVRVR
jgi:hypothetical protein